MAMKRKWMYVVVAVSALVLIACAGLPGGFWGYGTMRSAVDPEGSEATFDFLLIALDEEADPPENTADAFHGVIGYTDIEAGVDIFGDVQDAVDIGFSEEETGGIYEDDTYGEYGAFGGYWTGVVPGVLPCHPPVVTEGIFVVRVKDTNDIDPDDGLQIQLFDGEAELEDIDDPDSEHLLYFNQAYINSGDIVRCDEDSPEGQTAALIAKVAALDLDKGISNSLKKKLNNALAAFAAKNADQRNDAIHKLRAFIHSVEAQRGKGIDDSDADFLVKWAQAIIAGTAL
jgi:hypothetical protein